MKDMIKETVKITALSSELYLQKFLTNFDIAFNNDNMYMNYQKSITNV